MELLQFYYSRVHDGVCSVRPVWSMYWAANH